MSENVTNSLISDITLTPEEVLGPPKIDIMGVGIMLLLAIVIGFISSVGVVLAAFFSLGKFTLESGVSPVMLAMITFFTITISDCLFVWAAKSIFPHIYSGSRTVILHVCLFSVILYIVMMPLYMIAPGAFKEASTGILIAYILHILFNIFGLELIMSTLSNFRYVLLSIYSGIASLIVTIVLLFFLYKQAFSSSNQVLFVLLALSLLAFAIAITMIFFIRYCYYKFYIASGNDPIGDTFSRVIQEERDRERTAESVLLSK